MPMPVRRLYAHEKVLVNQGKVSLMRGPITYCIEAVDNPNVDVFSVALPRKAELRAEHRDRLLGGVTVLQGKGLDDRQRPVTLTAVPYYSWANREKGAMTVWIDEAPVASAALLATSSAGVPEDAEPERWCELLIEHAGANRYAFHCKASAAPLHTCSYAMNKNTENFDKGNAPPDMVLLFETHPGWNQTGGPELLTTDNHQGEGCNVLYVNGHVRFVKTRNLDKLKW